MARSGSLLEQKEKPKFDVRNFAIEGSVLEAQSIFLSPDFPDSYQFPWNPDPLARGNNYKIYDEMRDDDQIKAAISLKKDMVVNTGWDIICDNEEIRDFIVNNLENLHEGKSLDTTWDDALRDILTSYEYGFSISEPVFKLNDESKYELAFIKIRPPHTFRFELDVKGDVIEIVQTGNEGDLRFKPNKFLHYVYQQEFNNPYGKSDLRSAHKPWKIKMHFVKFFAIYVERFATPPLIGKYPPEMDTDAISAFNAAINSLQNNTHLVIPDNVSLDPLETQRDASDAYIKGLNFFNMMIARSILVPDLLGVSGEKTSGGSFALGEKQFELFLSTIQKDRESLQRKINQKIIKPLTRANWGDEVECKFQFKPFESAQVIEFAKAWAEAVKGKIFDPNEEEVNHFRKSLKFPQGPVSIPKPEMVDPLTGKPRNPGNGNKPGNPGQKKPLGDDDKKEKKSFTHLEYFLLRDKTSFEKKVDFAQIQTILDKSESAVTPDLTRAGNEIMQSIIEQIRDKRIIKNFKPERVNEIEPKFMRQMNMVFKTHFKDLFKRGVNDAKAELLPKMQKFVEGDILPEEFLTIIEAESFKVVGDYVTRVSGKAKNLLMKGIKDGLSEGELVTLIRDDMKSETERWIGTMVRTKTTEMYNSARKTYWDTDPLASQIIEAYQYSAIIDTRTSNVCRFLDGKIFEKGELTNRVTPPTHFNCRSLLVPVTRFEDYKSDKNFIPRGQEPPINDLQKKGGNLIVG